MSVETMIESSSASGGRSLLTSPLSRKSPSPPSTNALASHLLAAVSQVQSLTSQLPPSIQIPSHSPPSGGGCYRTGGFLPQLHLGAEPPMSSLLAGLKDFPRPYHSPPPLPSSENHECKIVEYRGAKVAAFIINGETMLCLPQAFEMFLKHLVGGLHTVYTKLKRLTIEPIVCNVDQVRILRGLGAIQPGVNRCKLLSVKHFDILYRDCTTASSRPGRPPKRASDFMSMASSPESIFELKKRHLDNSSFTNGHVGSGPDKSPILANGYPGPPPFNPLQYMAHHMAGLSYPGLLPGGIPGGIPGNPPHPISPPESSPMKQITPESLVRLHEERIERERQMMLDARRGIPPTSVAMGLPASHPALSHHHLGSIPATPTSFDDQQAPSSPVLNLSKGISSGNNSTEEREDDDHDTEMRHHNISREDDRKAPITTSSINVSQSNSVLTNSVSHMTNRTNGRDEDRLSDMDDEEIDKDESMDTGDVWSLNSSTPGQQQLTPPPPCSTSLVHGASAPLSSTEVLLRNILGLLRVAEENARHHERQTQYEKAELKMEVLREREMRETLEKQLQEEQKNRVLMQKRCTKLKKLRRRLQERLDVEVKCRNRYDEHMRSGTPENLTDINGSMRKEMEAIATELKAEHQLEERAQDCSGADKLHSSSLQANHTAIAASGVTGNSW